MAKKVEIKDLAEALEVIAKLEADKAEQAEVIKELRADLSASNKVVAVKENIVSLKDKKYKITAPSFFLNGEKHLAAEVESDSDVLKELVELEAGFLVAVD
jgi:hypothetical protein